jgi:hypothetical protein
MEGEKRAEAVVVPLEIIEILLDNLPRKLQSIRRDDIDNYPIDRVVYRGGGQHAFLTAQRAKLLKLLRAVSYNFFAALPLQRVCQISDVLIGHNVFWRNAFAEAPFDHRWCCFPLPRDTAVYRGYHEHVRHHQRNHIMYRLYLVKECTWCDQEYAEYLDDQMRKRQQLAKNRQELEDEFGEEPQMLIKVNKAKSITHVGKPADNSGKNDTTPSNKSNHELWVPLNFWFDRDHGLAVPAATFGSHVQFQIPSFGDFISNVHLNIVLPPLSNPHVGLRRQGFDPRHHVEDEEMPLRVFQRVVPPVMSAGFARYVDYPGNAFFKSVKFEVNGSPLDEYTSEELELYDQFKMKPAARPSAPPPPVKLPRNTQYELFVQAIIEERREKYRDIVHYHETPKKIADPPASNGGSPAPLMMSFSLYPDSHQPSGHVNYSRDRELFMNTGFARDVKRHREIKVPAEITYSDITPHQVMRELGDKYREWLLLQPNFKARFYDVVHQCNEVMAQRRNFHVEKHLRRIRELERGGRRTLEQHLGLSNQNQNKKYEKRQPPKLLKHGNYRR